MIEIVINFSGGTVPIIDPNFTQFLIIGTGTLSSNYTINSSGDLFIGRTHIFYYKALVNRASYNFNILGTNLTDLQLSRDSTIEAVYNGTTWDLNVYINTVKDDWVASSISGTWENIPYDDGDIINSPATTGTYTNTAGTEGVNYLGQWRTYKGNAANYSATTPSARRLKYRKNLDGTVQVMGHLRKQFAVPAATTSFKLDDTDYTNTIVYSADTITGLTASRNYTLSAFINASYIDL